MKTQQTYSLDQMVAEIQRKWGHNAIQTLAAIDGQGQAEPIPSGFSKLDAAIGGIPAHALTVLRGVPTAGTMTVTYHLVAQAQRQGKVVAYVDCSGTYDVQYATSRCGVFETQLLHIQPEDSFHSLEITRDLISLPAHGLLVLDMGLLEREERALADGLAQLLRATNVILRSAAWTVVLLLPSGLYTACDRFAGLVLAFFWARWIERSGQIVGYTTRVAIKKHLQYPVGHIVAIPIYHDGGRS